jgi:hypothetical protein
MGMIGASLVAELKNLSVHFVYEIQVAGEVFQADWLKMTIKM